MMIKLENISKKYKFSDTETNALAEVSLEINSGEFVAIMGASGSGKSTLLNIIGCMDTATSGNYYLNGEDVFKLKPKELCRIRNEKITFVFQNFALLEKYTAYENIELPLVNRKVSAKERKKKVSEVARQLGIENQLHKLPKQMSGGQQQRVALARALVSGADIILADEPTGALDSENAVNILKILKDLSKQNKCVIIVSHDDRVKNYADKVLVIENRELKEVKDEK